MRLRSPINKIVSLPAILFFLIFPALSSCDSGSMEIKKPVAVKGVLDLRGWNLERDGSLRLDGDWEFYWDRLPGPSDFSTQGDKNGCGFIRVPGSWEGRPVNGVILPGKGRATYRLTIIAGPDARPKTLTIHRIYSAYKLWINTTLMDEMGKAGGTSKFRDNYIFIHNKRYSSFVLNKGMNEIIIQVFNHDYDSGGIDSSILLDDKEILEQKKFQYYTAEMIVFGLLMFASIYNILFYFFRRQDASSLYFGLFCLAIAINTFNHHYPILSGCISYPRNPLIINYLTVILAFSMYMTTIRSMFPYDFSPFLLKLITIITAVFFIVLIPVGFRTAEQIMKFYFIIMFILICYSVVVLIRAIVHRRKDAIIFLAGFTPLLIGGINDLLYVSWMIDTTNVTQYGVVIHCIVITMIISQRYSRALKTVEELSEDLAEKNITLRKMDRLKDQFLASTSHELRTPLHGMIGLSESMLEGAAGGLTPKVAENLSLIAASGHRLANMVNDLLDMAKIQDEGLSLNLRPVDLYSLSEMVVKLSLPLVGGKSLKIINTIAPGTPAAHADEDRIRQVLCNLVGNAIKFTNRGTIELSARVLQQPDNDCNAMPGEMIEVNVSDTGIGVPDEFREKIFEPYRQADGGDTRAYPGTGLGLTIVKQIVELHNGAITVAPGAGGGSVFTFTLPVSNGPAPDVPEPVIIGGMDDTPQAGEAQAGAGTYDVALDGNPVILVVDDDPVCIRVIQNYFESKRCVVKTASDGIRALDIIDRDNAIDLVLLDIMMPAMSGYDVCKRIRASRSPEELPVIMLTAKNMMADINAAFDAGANDYIMKPFRIRELLARVGTMLKLRNIRRSTAEGITIRGWNMAYSFKFSDIIRITSHSKNSVIHTAAGDIEVPAMMKEIIERFPPDMFLRIHKSHIININYVHSITHVRSGRYRVRLRDNVRTELPVGPAYLESLRKKF